MKRLTSLVDKKFDYLVYLFIAVYTLAAVSVAVNRYWQYQTFYFDFGIYDTALWKVAHFQIPIVDHVNFSEGQVLILGDHFTPSVFLLSFIYWFSDRRELILASQSIILALSALLGFKMSHKFIKNKLARASLVVAFLGYVGTQNALISDFHEVTVAVLPLMLIFWAIFNKKWKLYFLFLIIFLGFKESLAGLGVAIGLYLLIKGRTYLKVGLSTIVISIAWGILTIKYLIPFLSGGVYLYSPSNLPANLSEFISRFILPSSHLETIIYTFATFGFLPIFDLAVIPGVFENFFERFVLSDRGTNLGRHYNALLAPLMFVGALFAFNLIEKKFGRKITSILALVLILNVFFLHRFILHGPLSLAYNKVFYEQNKRVEYVDKFVANFPKIGVIMTQNDLSVRLTHQNVKLLRADYKKINPDYVILNLTDGQNPNSFFPISFEEAKLLKDNLLKDPMYKVTKFSQDQYLFSKKIKN